MQISAPDPDEQLGRRGRRTQSQRRAETRTALLDAALECLVRYGYANTTTGRIADLAGVSRGAQTPYFRTRAELVGAAVTYLATKRIDAVRARFADGPIPLEAALDALWSEHRGVLFDASVELWVASRTDPALRTVLHEVERDVATAIAAVAVSAIGERANRPGFGDDLVFVLSTIRGLALLRVSDGGSDRSLDTLWTHTRQRLVTLLS